MKMKLVVLCLMICIPAMAFAHDKTISYYDGLLSNDYYVNGEKLNMIGLVGLGPLENALSAHPLALSQFKSGQRSRNVSNAFIGVGVFVSTFVVLLDITTFLSTDDNMDRLLNQGEFPFDRLNNPIVWSGLGLVAVGVPISVYSHSQMGAAIDLFNKGPNMASSMKLRFSLNSLGLRYQF